MPRRLLTAIILMLFLLDGQIDPFEVELLRSLGPSGLEFYTELSTSSVCQVPL